MTPTTALFVLMVILPNGEMKQFFTNQLTFNECEERRETLQKRTKTRTFKCMPVK